MKTRYNVEGIDCPNCAAKLEGMIAGKDGIASCKINFITEKIAVESELAPEELDALVAKTAHAFSAKVKVTRA